MRFPLGRDIRGWFPERLGARGLIVFLTLAASFALSTVSDADVNAGDVVVIDGNVAGAEALLAGLESDTAVEFIDPTRDGIEQIGDILAARSGVGSR